MKASVPHFSAILSSTLVYLFKDSEIVLIFKVTCLKETFNKVIIKYKNKTAIMIHVELQGISYTFFAPFL